MFVSSGLFIAFFKSTVFSNKKILDPLFRNGYWKCVGKLPDAHSSTIYSVDYAPARAGHGRIVSAGADNRIQIYREVIGSTSDLSLIHI